MKHTISYLPISILIFLVLGGSVFAQQPDIQTLIDETKQTFVPDSRVDQFNVEYKTKNGSLILTGETTTLQAKKALLEKIGSNSWTSVIDSIVVLPAQELGDEIYGLVNNSVSNIRSEPRHSAQLATQALLGMPLKVLKKRGGWYYVRTPEDYLSWVDSGGLHRVNKAEYQKWKDAEKLIYLDTYGFSYQEPSLESARVSDLTTGNILKLNKTTGDFYEVSYPDGRVGYVPVDQAKPFDEWNSNLKANQESLRETAFSMMGIPYLWGGTSTKGVDCSGFTKTIYLMNGMVIPRDASQQVHAGVKVDDSKKWEELEVGDLLFFGSPATENRAQRVVHVGMWIGNNEFIHSSRHVRISSVDSTSSNYDRYNVNRYLESRRYLQNMEGNIIQTGSMYDEMLN